MVRESVPQRGWRSLIEQNPHALRYPGSGNRKTLLGMLQHCLCLLPAHARKPLQKVIEPCALLQIREERLHGHARPSEHRRTTYFFRSPFDSEAFIPIEHTKRLADESIAGKADSRSSMRAFGAFERFCFHHLAAARICEAARGATAKP